MENSFLPMAFLDCKQPVKYQVLKVRTVKNNPSHMRAHLSASMVFHFDLAKVSFYFNDICPQ